MGLRQLHRAQVQADGDQLEKAHDGRGPLPRNREGASTAGIRVMTRFTAFLFSILLIVQPALAGTFEELIARLGVDSFSEKAEAVQALGALGDGRAIPILKALTEGRLATIGGRIAMGEGSAFVDAVSGQALASGEAERVRVNNRLRGAVQTALASLQLFSAVPAERLAAAREAAKSPVAGSVPALERALAAETQANVRAALKLALAAAQLTSGTNTERLIAIDSLKGSSDPQVRSLLLQVANGDAPDEVKEAARAAAKNIEFRLQIVGGLENLYQGISLGSVLLLAAIGLAITFGVMGVINMAHGEMIMIGAYATFVTQEVFRAFLPGALDAYLIAALPIAFLIAGGVGILLERTVIQWLYGRPLETMLATWGISLILQQAVRLVFGAPNKEVANPSWMTGGIDVGGGVLLTYNRLVIIVFCLAVLGLVALVLRRTTFGLHMRAVTQNREMASAVGIRTARVDALTFGLGSGVAGIAGVALSQIGNVSPNLGQIYIVDSFMVVVFGGVGNLVGTFVGAMVLGVVNKLLEPVAGAVLGKIVVLVAIILFIQKRPRGLFALKGRSVES